MIALSGKDVSKLTLFVPGIIRTLHYVVALPLHLNMHTECILVSHIGEKT